MIDKILPCPECGDYPDIHHYHTFNDAYQIRMSCNCKETHAYLLKRFGPFMKLVSEWNDFAEANQTIKVLKRDLKYVQDGLECMKNRFEEIFTDGSRHELVTRISVKLKKYLPKES